MKPDNGRDYAFNRGRGGYGGGFNYGQNPREHALSSVLTRNVISCNRKYLLVASNVNAMMNLSVAKIKEKLDKRV